MRLVTLLMLSILPCFSSTTIQVRDFLCGCEYCKTVNPHEPLDIGGHMIRCHSWRKGMQKTMEMMNQTKKPEVIKREVPKENNAIKKENPENPQTPNSKHKWDKDIDGAWIYSKQYSLIDSWLYREDSGWFWAFNKGTFLFSENYGWLYNYIFNKRRIFYWYDKRAWILPKDLPKPK